MSIAINIFGIIALLLWGLRMVRTGIMRSYGTTLKRWVRHTEDKTAVPFLSGIGIALFAAKQHGDGADCGHIFR